LRELGVRAGLHPRRNRDGSCDARCVVIEAMRDAGYVEVPVDKLIQIRMSKGRHLSQEESAGNAAALASSASGEKRVANREVSHRECRGR